MTDRYDLIVSGTISGHPIRQRVLLLDDLEAGLWLEATSGGKHVLRWQDGPIDFTYWLQRRP